MCFPLNHIEKKTLIFLRTQTIMNGQRKMKHFWYCIKNGRFFEIYCNITIYMVMSIYVVFDKAFTNWYIIFKVIMAMFNLVCLLTTTTTFHIFIENFVFHLFMSFFHLQRTQRIYQTIVCVSTYCKHTRNTSFITNVTVYCKHITVHFSFIHIDSCLI